MRELSHGAFARAGRVECASMRRRRLTSLLVLLTLFVGTVLPLHAGAPAWRADAVARDFCTTTGTRDTPVAPDRAHDDTCVTCFVCSGGAAAPGRAALTAPVVPRGWQPTPALPLASRVAAHSHALARGPPALA